MATEQITVRLPAATLTRLDQMAKRLGASRNRIVLEAVDSYVSRNAGSAYDLLEDLCGAAQGAPAMAPRATPGMNG